MRLPHTPRGEIVLDLFRGAKLVSAPNLEVEMIGYVTIGAKDSEASGKFYDAVLGTCGCERKFADGGWIGYGPCGDDNHSVYICPPFNKEPASFGNGMMIAFKAHSQEQVDAAHAAGLKAGGSDEG